MSPTRFKVALVCAALTALFALVLRWETALHEISGRASSCSISETVDCDKVQASAYGRLFGVSLSAWGLAAGLILLGWLLAARRSGPTLLAAAGVLAAFNLLAAGCAAYVASFVLGAVCPYCIAMQVTILGAAIAVLPPAWRARAGWRREPALLGALLALVVLGVVTTGDAYASSRAELLHMHARPTGNLQRIDISDSMQIGNREADLVVVIYFDFGCPVCRDCYHKARQFVRDHPAKVVFYFKQYPLDRDCNPTLARTVHPAACRASVAAQAAQSRELQADALAYFFERDAFTWPVVERFADDHGIDRKEFRQLLDSVEIGHLVARDIAEGNALKLDGVPAAWVNGRRIDNNLEILRALLGR
jgi:protein-disulfide isomerase